MEISEKLFKEIQNLSKSEWNALRVGVDHLFALETKVKEKDIFLSPDAEEKLGHCPKPIFLQKTKSPDHGNITGEHGHGGHCHSAGGHAHSMGEHRHYCGGSPVASGHGYRVSPEPMRDHRWYRATFLPDEPHLRDLAAAALNASSHAVVGATGIAEEWKPYLGIVDSKDLLDELHKRGEDTEKLVIAAWKEGESLTEIEKKFGDFGLFVIEKYKERKRIRV